MLTNVKTPQEVFFSPQRLVVPLFQRPYVWSLERQWRPLWEDVKRVAERFHQGKQVQSHFLGAIVLQQQTSEIGNLSLRTVIDGQQRLTTLQLMFDAINGVLVERELGALAQQMENLVKNQDAYISAANDQFKVWPTNRDRAAFNEVMEATLPDYSALENRESRLVRAHQYFFQEVQEWLADDSDHTKAHALVTAVGSKLDLVVIELMADEDAQGIFETLNARGTPLTAADLIKNFVFQRLQLEGVDTEKAYQDHWEAFETPFWETEVSVGRIKYSRSSLFFSQWLVAMTGEDITVREVFSRFKVFTSDNPGSVQELLPRISRTAEVYRVISEGADKKTGVLSPLEMFVYRMNVLDTESAKPVLIWLTDPDRDAIPEPQLAKALASLESWYVRRALIKATSQNYNNVIAGLVRELSHNSRENAGDVTENYLQSQVGPSNYWPGDSAVHSYITVNPMYRKLTRRRMRMILEAVEDQRRGFHSGNMKPLSEQPVARDECTIEHLMPQEWRSHWPAEEYLEDGTHRDQLVHRLGNLVLLTQSLNSKMSNGPWSEKRTALVDHSTLLTTKSVVDENPDEFSDDSLLARTRALADAILSIWPVPAGHEGLQEAESNKETGRVTVADLISAGFLEPGQTLFARVQAHRGHEGYVAEDGAIFVNGLRFETPSAAAREVTKRVSEPGWWFWVTDLKSLYALSDARLEYMDSLGVEDSEVTEDGD